MMINDRRQLQWMGIVFCVACLWTAGATAREGPTVKAYAQGVTNLHPEDLVRSRKEALDDLFRQSMWQVLGKVVESVDTPILRNWIAESVGKDPQKYVGSYELLGEERTDSLYRLLGLVTVNRSALIHDLRNAGVLNEDQDSSLSAGNVRENTTSSQGSQPSMPQPEKVVKDIYWAVFEKRGTEWMDPWTAATLSGSFVTLVQNEAQDYFWNLGLAHLPNVRDPDDARLESVVLQQARSTGRHHVVVGRLDPGGTGVKVKLSLLNATTGKTEATFEDRLSLSDEDREDAKLQLAGLVVSKLDKALRQPVRGPALSKGWTVMVTAQHPYAAWEKIARRIQSQGESSVQTVSMTLGGNRIVLVVQGPRAVEWMSLDGWKPNPDQVVKIPELVSSKALVRIRVVPQATEETSSSEVVP